MSMHQNPWAAMRSLTRDGEVAKRKLAPGTIPRIAAFARPYRRQIIVFLVLVILDALLVVALPLLFKVIVDEVAKGADGSKSTVVTVALGVALLALVDAGLTLWQRYLSSQVGEGLIYDLRTRVFAHVQRMPVAFFTRTQTGALVSRLNTDVVGAQQAFTSTLSSVVSNVIGLILVLATMLYLSWQITLGALVLTPLFLLPARWVGRRLQAITREAMQLNAGMGTTMTERFNVSGALLVKLFGRLDDESTAFAGKAGQVRDIGIKQAMYGRVFFTSLTLVASLATALVYGVGGVLAIDGTITAGHAGGADRAARPAVRPAHGAVQRAGRRDDRAGLLRARLRGARPAADDRREAGRRGAAARHHGRRAAQRVVPLPERRRGLAGLARVGRGPRPGTEPAGPARRVVHGAGRAR